MAGKATRHATSNRAMFWTMIGGAIFRRRSRAVMAVIASMVGAATLFCLAAISIAVPQQMNEDMRNYGANLVVTSTAGMSDDTIKAVENTVEAAGETKAATYRYESVRINSASYVMAGIDVEEVQNLNHHWSVDGDWPSDGRVMVGSDVADALGVKVGSTLTIGYRSESEESSQTHNGRVNTDILDTDGKQFQVSGIVDTGGSEDDIVYAANADMNALAGESGPTVIEFSSSADESKLSELAESINSAQASDYAGATLSAQQVTKMTSSNQRIIVMLQTLFWIVSIVVLALTLVGVSTTMASIVAQRRNEIGLRKALGASSGSVAVEFFVESALYGLLGGFIGMVLGYVLARVLCAQVFDRSLAFNVPLALVSVLLSVVLAIVASIPPVSSATRIDPAVVLREE